MIFPDYDNWFWGWFNWCRSSTDLLRIAEEKILSYVKTRHRGWFVKIGPIAGKPNRIWTISLNEDSEKTPIVLCHGMGAGVALWAANLDALAASGPVYAFDVLGFGKSSRPEFSKDAREVEDQWVRSIEEWRSEMRLEKMVLLGHSMGGFLATSYAIKYPKRVKHLVLADPWGFSEKPPDWIRKHKVPLWVNALVYALNPFNPLWIVRAAGPFAQWLIQTARPDIIRLFDPILKEDVNILAQYIHQCNAQTPTGESAFHSMMNGFAWAKFPMVNRVQDLAEDIGITFLYGKKSWVDYSAGEIVKQKRPDSYVNVVIIEGAAHQVYVHKRDIFNEHVIKVRELSESLPTVDTSSAGALRKIITEDPLIST